jgi:hypothetical protein
MKKEKNGMRIVRIEDNEGHWIEVLLPESYFNVPEYLKDKVIGVKSDAFFIEKNNINIERLEDENNYLETLRP